MKVIYFCIVLFVAVTLLTSLVFVGMMTYGLSKEIEKRKKENSHKYVFYGRIMEDMADDEYSYASIRDDGSKYTANGKLIMLMPFKGKVGQNVKITFE